jgi:hypothetical protein
MKLLCRLAPICAFALVLSAVEAHAQGTRMFNIHNVDVGGNAIGQYTTEMTDNFGYHQATTDSFGGNFSLRAHPVAWAGIEFNYSYTDFHERYTGFNNYDSIKTDMHEATAAYIFHPHLKHLQPFVNVGGGYIDFVPPVQGPSQWRGAGLLEIGTDIPTSNPHFGFRVQGRALFYRNPNFYYNFGTANWVGTGEPSFGAWVRF